MSLENNSESCDGKPFVGGLIIKGSVTGRKKNLINLIKSRIKIIPLWQLNHFDDVIQNRILFADVISQSVQVKCHLCLVKVCGSNPEGTNVTAEQNNELLGLLLAGY